MRISRDLAIIEHVDGVQLLRWNKASKKTERIWMTYEELEAVTDALGRGREKKQMFKQIFSFKTLGLASLAVFGAWFWMAVIVLAISQTN